MRWLFPFALLAIAIAESSALAQSPGPRQPPASSRRINGRDGDVVVIKGDDRLTVVRRQQGVIRLVFDSSKRSLVLLTDSSNAAGEAPDGKVDGIYTFGDVSGDWPLGARWEGSATVDEYWVATSGRRATVITTANGSVQLRGPLDDFVYLEGPPSITLVYRSSGTRQGSGKTFDEAERIANDPTYTPRSGVEGGLSRPIGGVVGAVSSPLPQQPGASRQPVKLFDVKPTYPKHARDAGIAGSVILQITVAADGAVTDARIVRGIPELNDAALQAVRQWRYDMSTMSGPVTLIVTVPFGM